MHIRNYITFNLLDCICTHFTFLCVDIDYVGRGKKTNKNYIFKKKVINNKKIREF